MLRSANQKQLTQTILGLGRAAVAGAPKGFSLLRALRKASRIRMAIAFAHMSGWQIITPAFKQNHTRLEIITGLDFCLTEPGVLREWLKLSRTGNVEPYLYPQSPPTFHPKVIIVEGPQRFAIVGSGNLSGGGLRDNVECSVYVADSAIVKELIAWFDQERGRCEPLFKSDIEDYEPKYDAAKKARKRIEKHQKEAERKIAESVEERQLTWNDAIKSARRYLSSNAFRKHDQKRWSASAARIGKLLHIPRLDFNKDEWKQFFQIEELGDVVPIYSDQLFANKQKLRKALRYLVDEAVPIYQRVNALLSPSGRFGMRGFGQNLVTKILCAHKPRKWPVLNGPVRNVLNGYGYEEPKGSDVGQKYQAFARMMQEFRAQTGATDMIAIDAFFFTEDQKQER